MRTPAEIVEEVRKALESRDYKAFADCFHEEGIYERPYALKGGITQYKGADTIYQYIESGMAPLSSAESFKIASSAALITCTAGKITTYRDFPNSVGIAQAAGSLPQFAASLMK